MGDAEKHALDIVKNYIQENKDFMESQRQIMLERFDDPMYRPFNQANYMREAECNILSARYIENWLKNGDSVEDLKNKIFNTFIENSISKKWEDRVYVFAVLSERLFK